MRGEETAAQVELPSAQPLLRIVAVFVQRLNVKDQLLAGISFPKGVQDGRTIGTAPKRRVDGKKENLAQICRAKDDSKAHKLFSIHHGKQFKG